MKGTHDTFTQKIISNPRQKSQAIPYYQYGVWMYRIDPITVH